VEFPERDTNEPAGLIKTAFRNEAMEMGVDRGAYPAVKMGITMSRDMATKRAFQECPEANIAADFSQRRIPSNDRL
jgi:hypothetical protein